MILKSIELMPFMSNCYIVGSEETGEGIIIDPGSDPDTILRAVRALGLSVALLVATHSHMDHVGAVGGVKEATGADYAIHEAEADDSINQGMSKVFGPLFGGSRLQQAPKPDRLLKDGDIIEAGELSFTVLHTPGHSPGGISIAGHGVVFSGDTLFNSSIGRTDFPGCSYEQLMESIFSKLLVLPEDTVVLSGHGPSTTIGDERARNPFVRDWMSRRK
ncbi:MBL fold metallo-hydrolase [Chloroflexota bacterium]